MNGGLKLAQLDAAISDTLRMAVSANDRYEEETTIQIIISRVRDKASLVEPNGDPLAALVMDVARRQAGTPVNERTVRSRAITVDLRKPAANDHFDEVEHASPELVAVAAETIATPIAAATRPPAAALSGDEELVVGVEELELDLDDSGIVSIETESVLPLAVMMVDPRPCAAPPADAEIELDASDLLEIDHVDTLGHWQRQAA